MLQGTILTPKILRWIQGLWKNCVFLFWSWPNLALRNNLYLHNTVSTNCSSFRLTSSLRVWIWWITQGRDLTWLRRI